MAEIALKRVVSVSSSDPRHPAENLLRPGAGGRWRAAAAGEKQLSVELELVGEGRIHTLHIGNDGAAFVEVLVGVAAGGDFQVLLPTAAFMSPRESRAGEEPRRVRFFGPEALVRGVAGRGWDRVRVVCRQPYCQTRPFGLSFIRLFAPPGAHEEPPPPPVRRLGAFTLREEGGSPRRPPGALFYQRPPSPTAPAQDPPGPSYAVATLQASASSAPKGPTPATATTNRRDFFEDKTFFFHGEFPAGEGRLLLRYVTAFGGTLAPYMNDSVTHVVTAQDWDPAFEEALELRPSLTFVRPRWLLLCGERQRPLPAQPFAVVPRP